MFSFGTGVPKEQTIFLCDFTGRLFKSKHQNIFIIFFFKFLEAARGSLLRKLLPCHQCNRLLMYQEWLVSQNQKCTE